MLCQFGDGAINTGAFHESLNLAAVWQLPIVFQVINNLYGMGTSVEQSSRRAGAVEARRRPIACTVSGLTATTCWRSARRRRGCSSRPAHDHQPSLLETITYRYRGHSVADAGKAYRTKEEIESWRERDPITRFGLLISERGLVGPTRDRDRLAGGGGEVNDAIDQALAGRRPAPANRCTTTCTVTRPCSEQFSRMRRGAPRLASVARSASWPT